MKITLLPELKALAGRAEFDPTPAEVKAARLRAKLSKTDAARLMRCSRRGWIQWEDGTRQMRQSAFELFVLLTQSEEARALCLRLARAHRKQVSRVAST